MNVAVRCLLAVAVMGTVAAGGPGHLTAQQQTGAVRGRVVDAATANPLSGVQVHIPGTGHGTITDERGGYLLVGVEPGPVVVRAEMLGYGTINQPVTVAVGQTATADFQLKQTPVALDELVVTATGQSRKKEIGNSMATINAADVAVAPVKGAQDMLNARAAGVFVLANSGQPGAGGTIRLRGNNSVSQGNNPIIYVDGVRIFSGNTPTMPLNRQSTLPLNDINALDIERIEIVKGPAATTLYGTEASGGVIQIFTKQGRTGKPSWTAEVAGGLNNMGHIGTKNDPTGMWINDCSGTGVNGKGVKFQDPTCPSNGTWLKNGAIQRYSLSVRGGGADLSYYVSADRSSEDGVLPNMGTNANGFRGNFSFRPAQTLDLTLNTAYTRRNTDWVPDGNSGSGFLLNVSRGPDGNFKGSGCSDPSVVCVNNAEIFTTVNTTVSDHYITGATLKYSPFTSWVNRLSVGYDYNALTNQNLSPFGFYRVPLGEMYWNDWRRQLITVDFASTFTHQLNDNFRSETAAGAQLFDSRTNSTSVTATDFSGPGVPTLTSAAVRDVTGDTRLKEVNAGFFVQETMSYLDRLFLTAGLRVDGNSSFGKDFGLQPYPKLSASYVLSDASFWPKDKIETLKLRAAVGESGKAPGAFDAVRTWDPIAADDGSPGFTPSQLGNPKLGPERTREYEAGFETSALDGRVAADFSYYLQRTMDALIPVTYPPSQGFLTRQLENIGKLETKGVELRLDGSLIRTADLEWRGTVNYTTINSKALDIGGEVYTVNTLARSYVKEGYPVPSYIGKKVMNPNEFADPIIQDTTYLGAPYPNKIISVSSGVTLFRRFTAEATGEWQLGGHLLNAVGYQNANKGDWYPCIAIQQKLNAAKAGDASALNDVTAMERVRCDQGSLRDYDWWVEANDFFKLRSVSLSYELPQRFIPGSRSARLTVSGRNLMTVTDYTGTDPETTDFRDNATSRRDYYVFPQSRSFLLSLTVNF